MTMNAPVLIEIAAPVAPPRSVSAPARPDACGDTRRPRLRLLPDPASETRPLAGRPLAPRELEVLTWVARGKSGVDIACILGISRHTVDTLVRRVLEKLGCTTRTQAAVRAAQAGWLPPV
jgi:DNA-binding CsgD family transcriptional regulator